MCKECICALFEVKPIKLRPSRLKQVRLPSAFHTEEYNILRYCKVNATTGDHLILRGQTLSRKMDDHHLLKVGAVVLPQYVVFLAAKSNIERLRCLVGRARVETKCDYSQIPDTQQDSIDCEGRYEVERIADYRCEDDIASQQTYLNQGSQRDGGFFLSLSESERNSKRVKVKHVASTSQSLQVDIFWVDLCLMISPVLPLRCDHV